MATFFLHFPREGRNWGRRKKLSHSPSVCLKTEQWCPEPPRLGAGQGSRSGVRGPGRPLPITSVKWGSAGLGDCLWPGPVLPGVSRAPREVGEKGSEQEPINTWLSHGKRWEERGGEGI